MKPLVGLGLGGPSFTPRSQFAAAARLGEPVWGPTALLRDLELRLALSGAISPRSVRVPAFAARIAKLADARAFYAASFAADAVGTADALLAWRDALVEAGWDAQDVPEAGERFAAIARLESAGERIPHGDADRLVAVLVALSVSRSRMYDEVSLAEDRSLWPGRWQSIFDALEASGTPFVALSSSFSGAPPATDLGRLQSLLRGDAPSLGDGLPGAIRGDGSLLVLRGDTQAELAALTAAVIAQKQEGTLVIRSGDVAPLEGALSHHGLAAQGIASSSPWRPAMQLLPLGVELAFEPRDPHRALELLTLGVGPFRGALGRRLARAVARSPGIGGREWQKQKDAARELLHARELERSRATGASETEAARVADAYAAERLTRVAEWLEAPAAPPEGAPKSFFLQLAARTQDWLHSRLASAPEVYGPGLIQAKAFTEALANDTRDVLSREAIRQLLDTVVRAPHDFDRSVESAGRVPHVAHPSAVHAPCSTLVIWNFVSGTERRPPIVPWNDAERTALRGAGVRLHDATRFLRHESDTWRRAVLAARERVVLAIPSTIAGSATAPHPLWDEISARLRLDAPAAERLARHAPEVLASRTALVPLSDLPPLPLPVGPAMWKVDFDVIGTEGEDASAATSLETLVTCPLRWVLESRAELRAGAVAKIASDSLLYGNLGHRLVEELFIDGAFELDARSYAARAALLLDRLVATEAATLLLPGMGFERAQLLQQLLRAARELRRYLDDGGFRIIGVEEEVTAASALGPLRGRLDVRLVDAAGQQAVLDLKWGETRYRSVVKEGRAIQLALYARALSTNEADRLPPAGYFALRSGRIVTADARMGASRTIDADALDVTWSRVQHTAAAVIRALGRGEIPVAGTRGAPPLLDGLQVDRDDHHAHYAPKPDGACAYCACAALCGRAWEGFR